MYMYMYDYYLQAHFLVILTFQVFYWYKILLSHLSMYYMYMYMYLLRLTNT